MTPVPRLAIWTAALRPMPELAPVTMATFMVFLLMCSRARVSGLAALCGEVLGQDPREPAGAGPAGGGRDARLGEQRVEAVEAARPDVQFGLAAGRPDAGGVAGVLVAEDFGGTCVDVGGRQAREVAG